MPALWLHPVAAVTSVKSVISARKNHFQREGSWKRRVVVRTFPGISYFMRVEVMLQRPHFVEVSLNARAGRLSQVSKASKASKVSFVLWKHPLDSHHPRGRVQSVKSVKSVKSVILCHSHRDASLAIADEHFMHWPGQQPIGLLPLAAGRPRAPACRASAD